MATHELPEELLKRCGLSGVEERMLPGRQGRYNPVPSGLESTLRELLTGQYPEGLYSQGARHRGRARRRERLCRHADGLRGKPRLHGGADRPLLRDRFAQVVVFCPARAFIRDQGAGWALLIQPLGVEFRRVGESPIPGDAGQPYWLDILADALIARGYELTREQYEVALGCFQGITGKQLHRSGTYRLKSDCVHANDGIARQG